MNEKLEQKLIEKHGYMFIEQDRSRKRMAEHTKLDKEWIPKRSALIKANNPEALQIATDEVREKRDKIGSYWPIAFGIECDDGWFEMLDELMTKLEKIDVQHKIEINQIKEKFGGLRFYISDGSIKLDIAGQGSFTVGVKSDWEEIHNLINEYQSKSYTICEICGKPGKLCKTQGSTWLKTVCIEHRAFKTYDHTVTYTVCRTFLDQEEVITPEKELCKVVSSVFNDEKDTWVYTVENISKTNRKIYLQEMLNHKPYSKFNKDWYVDWGDTTLIVERIDGFDPVFGYSYELSSVENPKVKFTIYEDDLKAQHITNDIGWTRPKIRGRDDIVLTPEDLAEAINGKD